MRALALLAVALIAAPTFAQDAEPLRPGSVDVSDVEPYEHSYRIFVKQGEMGGMPFGSVSEVLTLDDGVALLTVNVNSAQGAQADSIWFSWPNMEPMRYRSEAGNTLEDLSLMTSRSRARSAAETPLTPCWSRPSLARAPFR